MDYDMLVEYRLEKKKRKKISIWISLKLGCFLIQLTLSLFQIWVLNPDTYRYMESNSEIEIKNVISVSCNSAGYTVSHSEAWEFRGWDSQAAYQHGILSFLEWTYRSNYWDAALQIWIVSLLVINSHEHTNLASYPIRSKRFWNGMKSDPLMGDPFSWIWPLGCFPWDETGIWQL